MDCIKCGNQLREDDLFCGKCGRGTGPENGKLGGAIGIYSHVMTIVYGIALLICFICNLAVGQTLSWFYIVLSGVALAYSITNIPIMVKRHKLIISGTCATVMVYVLLFACNRFAGGGWLFSVAYPLATVSILFAWGILLVCASRRMDRLMKSALISLIAGASMITINPLCHYLLGEPAYFYDYLSPVSWPLAIIGNKIAFICCVCYSLIALTRNIRSKHLKKA